MKSDIIIGSKRGFTMPAKKDSKKKDEPEIEINAKWSGNEFWKDWGKDKKKSHGSDGGSGGALYFMGFVGSLVYWMQAAAGFGAVVTGLLKAMVWPAYVAYKLLEFFYGAA